VNNELEVMYEEAVVT